VVRLKNGDPLLFGRGGEEAAALVAAGIPFELVPGVSALQAGAAAAGIGLTHRGLADELRVLQGHHLLERPRDWAGLVRSGTTLALFMATRTLQAIARRLLEAGAPPDLPMVLVEKASLPGQTVTRSVLAHAAGGHLQPHSEGPGIVYLGLAAGLRMLPHDPSDADLVAQPAAFSGAPAPVLRPEPLAGAAGGGRTHRHREAAAAAGGGRRGALGGDPA
jgi:uroporphyrin-III C-methyltransferase